MSHHNNQGDICPLCADKIAQAHPKLQEIWVIIKKEFPEAHISWAFRNEKDQNEFYVEHKTRCKWPLSKHNTMKDGLPYARAVDLFQLDCDGQAWFPPKFYFDIANFLAIHDHPIQWAGNWTQAKEHFCETDHYQLNSDII